MHTCTPGPCSSGRRSVSLAFTLFFLHLPLPLWKLFLSHWKSVALYKTMWSWVFPWKNGTRNHFRRSKPSLCPGNSLLSCAGAVLYPAPVQDTQGTAGDAVFKKHLLVVLDFTESQAGWGLWGQTALSERICSAPLLRAGALRAGCSRCVQQGWRQKNQKTNVKERQGSGIAHVRMWVPLRMKDGVVLLKSFHLNKYMAFMMTKLLSKKF